MSCAWGLSEYGILILFSTNDEATWGVNGDVAHVSRTFFSASASPLHCGHVILIVIGSIGSSFSSGKIISPQLLHVQTGIGMPKCLFLEIVQSHSKPLTQFSYLFLI